MFFGQIYEIIICIRQIYAGMPASGRALVLVCAHMEGGGRYYTPLLTGTTVLDICPVFVFCICLCLAKDICRVIALTLCIKCSFN